MTTIRKPGPSKIFLNVQKSLEKSPIRLQPAAPTRWNTYAALTSSLLELKNCLKMAIIQIQVETECKEIAKIIADDEEFWPKLESLNAVLTPLANAVDVAQSDSMDQRKAYKKIRRFFPNP